LATITRNISTKELIPRYSELTKNAVKKSTLGNIYVELDGESYLVTHNGNKIPASTQPITTFREERLTKEAIDDQDVFERLTTIINDDSGE